MLPPGSTTESSCEISGKIHKLAKDLKSNETKVAISEVVARDDSKEANDKLCKNNPKGLIIAQLNINSIRNKSDSLKFLVAKNVDILVVIETKIDGTFPSGQFLIEGFKPPLRYDRNKHGGGILVYI